MAHFSIISSQGGQTIFEGAPRYVGAYLKPGYLEFGQIGSPTPINWHVGDYVVYSRTGKTYRLYRTPQTVEQGARNRYGASFLYENVQFFDDSKQLEFCPFTDLVPGDNTIHFSTQNTVSFFGKPLNVAERLQACLEAQYGSGSWEIRIVATTDADLLELLDTEVEFAVAGVNCLEVLDKIYETWNGLGWIHTVENGVNVITIGASNVRTSANTTVPFAYDDGLVRVEKSIANADQIGTRLFAYGSMKNMDATYYRGLDIYNAESVDIEHLMIPLAYWGRTSDKPDARKAYIENAEAIAQLGLIPRTAYFDGTGDLPDIHPTIERMTIGEVYDAGGAGYLPNLSKWSRTQRIDEIITATNPDDHGTSAEQGQKYAETISGTLGYVSETFIDHDFFNTTIFSGTLQHSGKLTLKFGRNRQVFTLGSAWSPIFNLSLSVTAGSKTQSFPLDVVMSSSTSYYCVLPDSVVVSGTTAGALTVSVTGYIGEEEDASSPGGEGVFSTDVTTTVGGGLEYELSKTFTVTIPQIGFDIDNYADLGNGKTISMKTGMCAGRDFEVKDATYISSDDSWVLTLYRSIDEDLNIMFPNADYEIAAGDQYVLLDIAMPEMYVTVASQRLFSAAMTLLADISVEQPFYAPQIDAKVVYNESRVLRDGMWMDISLDGDRQFVIIDSITIDENGSNVPTYEVALRETKGLEWTENVGRASSSRSSTSVSGSDAQQSSSPVDLSNYYTKPETDTEISTAITALNLGAAATYGVGPVASGNGGLVTGGSVYSAINEAVSSALKFQGITTTAISDGSTTNPITINNQSYTAKMGDVVLYDGKEYLWTGSAWEQLGDEASWALKTTTISAGTGLTGGGTLAANRTISLSQATIDSLALANTALQSHQTIYALTIKNSAGTTQLTYTPNSGTGSITLTKAMVGLGDVDNLAAADYFTALTSGSTDLLSITIGGTTKKLTTLYASRLTTVSKTIWGQTYWTANGVPQDVTAAPNLYIGTTKVQVSSAAQALTGITSITASGLIKTTNYVQATRFYLTDSIYFYTESVDGTTCVRLNAPFITSGDQIVISGTPGGGGGGGGATTLAGLDDTNITNPQAGQMLAWNGTKWVNTNAPTGSITSVSLAAGATNGTLHLVVNGTAQSDVAVTGLGSLAYKSSLAFSEITGTASASQIPSTVAYQSQPNNFVHSTNEWTVIPSGYTGNLWLNYRTVGGSDGSLTNYSMGNGASGYASVTASSFIKNGGTSSQFLKADGSVDSNTYLTGITSTMVTNALGYTPANSTALSNYVLKSGDTMTGILTLNYTYAKHSRIKFVDARATASTGGWADNTVTWHIADDTLKASMGWYGNGATPEFIYFGFADYYGKNFRIYPDGTLALGNGTNGSTASQKYDIYHQGNLTKSVLTTLLESDSGYYVKKSGDTMSGALTVNSNLSATGTVTLGSESSCVLYLNRKNNPNYIWAANTGGYLAFGVADKGSTSIANSTLVVNNYGIGVGGGTTANSTAALNVTGNAVVSGSVKIGSATITWNSNGYLHIDQPLVTAGDQIVISGTPGGGGGGGATNLWGLDDVNIPHDRTYPGNGDLLSYDLSTHKWVNVAASSVGGVTSVAGRTGAITLTTSDITNIETWISGKGYITSYTDTKNTTGADNTTSKIFLVGPTAQTTSNGNARTYSNANVYASGGKLYSNAKEVVNLSDTQALTNKTYNGYTLAAACAKGVTDNSSSADVTSSDTNLITGRTLYYQLAKKGYTTNTGTVTKVSTGTGLTGGDITSTGTISINSTYQTYITNGNTAHGWGNHASAGYVKLNPGASEQTLQSSISTLSKGVINLWRSSGDHYTFLGFSNGTTETYLGGIGFKSQSDTNLYHRIPGGTVYKIWDENNLTKSVITNLIGTTTYADYNANGYVSKAGDTMTGSLTLNDANGFAALIKNIAFSSTSGWERDIAALQVDGSRKFHIGAFGNYTAGGSSNGISYAFIGVNGYDGTNLRFGSDSTLKWGTDTIWHAGNDGSGSGLDADLLDGLHSSSFFVSNGNRGAIDFNTDYLTGYEYVSGSATNGGTAYAILFTATYGDAGMQVNFGRNTAMSYRNRTSNSQWSSWRTVYDTANANLSTVAWACSTLTTSGTIQASGNVYCGAIFDLNRDGSSGEIKDSTKMGMEIEATASYIAFKPYTSSGAAWGTILSLSSSGNVGIGTTTPGYKLDVKGVVQIKGASSEYGVRIANQGNTIDGVNGSNWGNLYLNYSSSGNVFLGYGGGNVGIGTISSASYKLEVNSGSVGDAIRLTSTTTYSCIIYTPSGSGKNWSVGANNNGQFYFYTNSASRAYFTQAGALVTTGDQVVSSDLTLKENLTPVTYSVADIAKARAVEFDWRDGRGHSMGSIAQDWLGIAPALVHGKDGNMSLAYGQLALVNTILLARQSESHEERIKELEARVAELEMENERLRMN